MPTRSPAAGDGSWVTFPQEHKFAGTHCSSVLPGAVVTFSPQPA